MLGEPVNSDAELKELSEFGASVDSAVGVNGEVKIDDSFNRALYRV